MSTFDFPSHDGQASKTLFTVVYSFVISIVRLGATSLLAYIIYKCFNIKLTTTGDGAAAPAEQRPALPDSVIRDTTIDNFLNEIAREKPIRFTAQQLDGYTQSKCAELGAGGSGTVYKGMLPNGLDIAVKVIHDHVDGEVTEQQFLAEVVGTQWSTNHTNLVRLIGYCFDANKRALVYELMPNGSLDKYLDQRRRTAVGSAALLAVAVGVARGLRYLHEECQKKFVHYDVKASSVLLDGDLTPKLTGFGITHAAMHAAAARGTIGYMAPEVIHVGTAPITEKCDVYSFGMLLFELVGRRTNMDGGDSAPESSVSMAVVARNMYEQGKLLELVKECHHPGVAAADVEQWKETAERMCKVASLCVDPPQPEARPTMSTVVNMLEGRMEIPSTVKGGSVPNRRMWFQFGLHW